MSRKSQQQPPPIAPIRFTSVRCHGYALLLWQLLIISLPLDLLLPLERSPIVEEGQLARLLHTPLPSALLVLGALGLIHEVLASYGLRILRHREQLLERGGPLLLAIIVLFTMAEIFTRLFDFGDFALVAAAVAGLAAFIAARRGINQVTQELRSLAGTPMLLIERHNVFLLMVTALPLLAARGYSAAGTLAEQSNIPTLISLVLLIGIQPREKDFIHHCRRCHQQTSRVLADERDCPRCNPGRYLPQLMVPQNQDGLQR